EQVIDRMHVECADCIHVECCNEHEMRQCIWRERVHHTEAIDAGHLNVEEHNIGCFDPDRLDRRYAVGCFVNRDDVRVVAQQPAQLLPGRPLVVHDQHLESRCVRHDCASGGMQWNGIRTDTVRPPEA